MGGKLQDECELYGNIPEHQEIQKSFVITCSSLTEEKQVAPESIWKERQDTA